MWRKISIVLWLLVLIVGLFWLADRWRPKPLAVTVNSGNTFVQLPWKYLPDAADFELKDTTGAKVEASDFGGRPYIVNFFYSTCPTICRQFNDQVRQLAEQFREEDVTFLSITVDPETDTPSRLAEYAQSFQADTTRWRFLTGTMSEIQNFAQRSFRIVLERVTHTEKLFLVDRWGKVRDQFSWDDPAEIRRLAAVTREVIAETKPPLDATITTRNLLAGRPHNEEFTPVILDEFFLTQTNGATLFSRDLLGEVWIGSVFFSTCPTHCVTQNRYLRDLQDRLGSHPVRILSISTDPVTDTPQRLEQYARDMKAQPNRWLFLTGHSKSYVDRVAAEFLGLYVQGSDHATELVLVDRWGRPRGTFDWRDPNQEAEMFRIIDELLAETHPRRADDQPKSAKPGTVGNSPLDEAAAQ